MAMQTIWSRSWESWLWIFRKSFNMWLGAFIAGGSMKRLRDWRLKEISLRWKRRWLRSGRRGLDFLRRRFCAPPASGAAARRRRAAAPEAGGAAAAEFTGGDKRDGGIRQIRCRSQVSTTPTTKTWSTRTGNWTAYLSATSFQPKKALRASTQASISGMEMA